MISLYDFARLGPKAFDKRTSREILEDPFEQARLLDDIIENKEDQE